MSDDLFAAPTPDEVADAKQSALFAPPTTAELAAAAPPPPQPTLVSRAASAVGNAAGSVANSVGAGLDEVGRGVPVLGPATVKAGYGLSAFLSRMTPDSALPESLRGRTIGELYDHFKQQDEDTQAKLMAEHPFAGRVGQVAGSLTAPIPGAGVPGVAGAAARIAGVSGLNAADAAMRGEDPVTAGEVGGGVAAGLEAIPVVGRVAGPLASSLGDAVEGAGGALRGLAERKAFKAAAGNQAKAYKAAGDRVNDIGRQLIDNGVVTFGASPGTIEKRAGEAADQAWSQMQGAMQQADQAVPGGAVSGKDIADAIRAKAKKIGGEGNKATIAKLNEAADAYEAMGDTPLSHAQIEKNSWDYKQGDDWNANNIAKNAVGDAMEAGVAKAGPKADEAYKGGKAMYGAMRTSEDAAEIAAQRLEKNNSASVGDKAAAAAAAALSPHSTITKMVAGAVAGTANKLVRRSGNAALAVTADNLGALFQKMPGLARRYGQMLTNAASRGNQALAVTHYMLSQQDPEYQRFFTGDEDEDRSQPAE